jgi:hypothetical protein
VFFPSMSDETMLAEVERKAEVRTQWFCGNGAVRERDDGVFEVVIGGVLIGWFSRGEPERRNLLLVALSDNPAIRLMDLARAFGLSTERLRQIREYARVHGTDALFERRVGRREPVSARLKKRIVALFEQGLKIDAAYAKVKRSTSRATVGRVHKEWVASKKAAPPALAPPEQLPLLPDDAQSADLSRRAAKPRARRVTRETRMERPPEESPLPEDTGRTAQVQHAGTWPMVAQLNADGLYKDAERWRAGTQEKVPVRDDLRLALDATAVTLRSQWHGTSRFVALPMARLALTQPGVLSPRRRPRPPLARVAKSAPHGAAVQAARRAPRSGRSEAKRLY